MSVSAGSQRGLAPLATITAAALVFTLLLLLLGVHHPSDVPRRPAANRTGDDHAS